MIQVPALILALLIFANAFQFVCIMVILRLGMDLGRTQEKPKQGKEPLAIYATARYIYRSRFDPPPRTHP